MLDNKLKLVRHVLANLINCPYSFKNCTIQREYLEDGSLIAYVKDCKEPPHASLDWEELITSYSGKIQLQVGKREPGESNCYRYMCSIKLLDSDGIAAIDEHNVITFDDISSSYAALTDFAYLVIRSIRSLIKKEKEEWKSEPPEPEEK